MTYFLLIIGFILLLTGANWLIKSASLLARHYGISALILGLTVVAVGTSIPEQTIGIISAVNGINQLTFGDVLGSCITNITLVLGIGSLIKPLHIKKSTVKREIPISFALQVILLALVLADGTLTRADGIVLAVSFISYVIYLFFANKRYKRVPDVDIPEKSAAGARTVEKVNRIKLFAKLTGGLAGLVAGGILVVDSSEVIARSFHLSEALIGVTIVAFGTSLPELTTSIVALLKKEHDIAIGNLVGSNIFNIASVLMISVLIHPIEITQGSFSDIYFSLGATALLFILALPSQKISRPFGALLLAYYIIFNVFKIVMINGMG